MQAFSSEEPTPRILFVKEDAPSPEATSFLANLRQLAPIQDLGSFTSEGSFANALLAGASSFNATSVILDGSYIRYLSAACSLADKTAIIVVVLLECCSDKDIPLLIDSSPQAIVTLNWISGDNYLRTKFAEHHKPLPRLLELTLQEPTSPKAQGPGTGRAIDVLAGAPDLPLKDLLMVRDAILVAADNNQVQANGIITEVRYLLHPDLIDSAQPLLTAPLSDSKSLIAAISVQPATESTLPHPNSALGVVLGTDPESDDTALNYIHHNVPTLVREDSRAVILIQRTASTKDYRRYIWERGTAEEPNNLADVMTEILADTSSAQILAADLRFGLAEISSPQACSVAFIDLLAQLRRENLFRDRLVAEAAPDRQLASNTNVDSIVNARADTFLQLGISQYELGRRAADRGDWSESFKHHSAGLVCFNEIGIAFWKARAAGRLAWIEIAQGRYANAYALLSDAASIDLLQGAANYLWAAQYAMRCHALETARRMLQEFVRTGRRNAFPFPSRSALSQHDVAAFEAIIIAMRDFYWMVVEQARNDGFGGVCLSDEGRFHVLEAVIAKDIDTIESELGIAAVCFSTVGLTSYAEFCEGRRQLLLACSSPSGTAGAYLDRAITTLGLVGQRFPGERDVLGALLSTASSHRSLLRLVDQFRAGEDIDRTAQLRSITPTLSGDSEIFGPDFLSTSAKIFLLVRRTAERPGPPDVDLSAQLGRLFRRLYDSIPTIDAFYSPQFRALLLNAMRDVPDVA